MIEVFVRGIRIEAEGIRSFELAPLAGELPAWSPGAHVQLSLPGGHRRAYSLCNHVGERDCYRIAVKRESASRGGSAAMHALGVGDRLRIEPPRNLFALDSSATRHVLLAGGIGITPLYAMRNHLAETRRAHVLHYFARPGAVAFADRLVGEGAQLHLGLDAAATAAALATVFAESAGEVDTCFYVCGPSAFMAAAEGAAREAGVPAQRLRSERFAAGETPMTGATGSFRVHFARSGVSAEVPPGVPIIAVARAHGVDIPSSCEMGVCGACQTPVLAGTPQHQDDYLSDEERASGAVIMPCVSRCASEALTLDC